MLTNNHKRIKILIVILAVSMFFLSISCNKTSTSSNSSGSSSSNSVKAQARAYFDFFDTVSYFYSYLGDSEEAFLENCDALYSIFMKYHQLFDIYNEYDGINNLATINRKAGEEAVKVEKELIEFLLYAKDLAEKTDGEMDITLGPVLSLWHDARSNEPHILPLLSQLEEAKEKCGFEYLELDEINSTVRLSKEGARIDVGALGKGYATEKAAEYLIDNGISSYVLNIGGNIRIIGKKPNGEGWITGIRDPQNPNSEFKLKINISDTSCVTSGNYERFFIYDGERYSHIIDKDTLFPSTYYSSVTVVTKDSGLADGLSTALFTLDWEDSKRLADKFGIDCLWIFNDGSVKYTDGFEKLIVN